MIASVPSASAAIPANTIHPRTFLARSPKSVMNILGAIVSELMMHLHLFLGRPVRAAAVDDLRYVPEAFSTVCLMAASVFSSDDRVLSTTIFRSIEPFTPVSPSCSELFSVSR